MHPDTDNPLLQPWNAPFGLPPFERVRADHFTPAFDMALAEHRAEIDRIVSAHYAPSFDNTIAALDRSGRLLTRIEQLFFNLAASETSPELQAVERETTPRLAAHHNAILQNAELFARVDRLHQRRAELGLDAEQLRLLERLHLDFVFAGAKLPAAVLRDFVELPSQLFEHWALEPAVLKKHARHFETGVPIPDALIARMKQARRFNQGFETVEYTACALVDMALHSVSSPDGVDLTEFERAELARLGMPREIVMRHRLPHFGHLFSSSSYAAGYYVYMWAEVLDADGYDAFVEAGDPFEPALAARLLKHVYSAGNTAEPRAAYRAFRGRDASVEPMLAKRGLIEVTTPA